MNREFLFNNVNLCESNVVQIFELIFCNREKELLIYLFRNNVMFFKSSHKLFIGLLVRRLEEVYQQPSINISFLPAPQLVKMNNFFGQYLTGL